ncbi:hypothetical protein O3P69_009049 [Scylla paramamosain]|uniref:Uncharacterized protein n=1 Tax=Scylla paramamosain TaxID=85552 RepID=A0AAW0TT50_SCYPA
MLESDNKELESYVPPSAIGAFTSSGRIILQAVRTDHVSPVFQLSLLTGPHPGLAMDPARPSGTPNRPCHTFRPDHNSLQHAECEAATPAPSGDSTSQPSRSPSPTRSSSPSPSPPAPTLTLTQHTLPEETESSPPREVTTSSVANDESCMEENTENGLQSPYTNDGDMHKYLRKLLSLPYVPAENIEELFIRFYRKANGSPQLLQLLDYVKTTWITSSIWLVFYFIRVAEGPSCRWAEMPMGRDSDGPNFVGTSDHIAVVTKIQFRRPSEETTARNLWRWEAANWDALKQNTDWGEVLSGEVDQQVQRLSELLHALQLRWVPHSNHTTKASDQPWFGPECRAAADAKYRA